MSKVELKNEIINKNNGMRLIVGDHSVSFFGSDPFIHFECLIPYWKLKDIENDPNKSNFFAFSPWEYQEGTLTHGARDAFCKVLSVLYANALNSRYSWNLSPKEVEWILDCEEGFDDEGNILIALSLPLKFENMNTEPEHKRVLEFFEPLGKILVELNSGEAFEDFINEVSSKIPHEYPDMDSNPMVRLFHKELMNP